MNRPAELLDSVLSGPSSVASLDNWVLTSSHSIGTAVRDCGIVGTIGQLRFTGPVERGQLDVTGGNQVLRDDHGLGVDRNAHVVIDLECRRRPGRVAA